MGKIKDGFTKAGLCAVAVATIASAGATVKYLSESIEINSKLDKIKEQKADIVNSISSTEEYERFIRNSISNVKNSHSVQEISDKQYEEQLKALESDDPQMIEKNVEMYLYNQQGYGNEINKLNEKEHKVSKEDDLNKTVMACFGAGVVAGAYFERKLFANLTEKENNDEDLVE